MKRNLSNVRRSKYGAVPTMVDGIRFASKKEARRYQELRLLERAGEIAGLTVQPAFPLKARLTVRAESMKRSELIGTYVGEFAYLEQATGAQIVEDVKGFRTPLYRWKKKHVEAQYGIVIREL